MANDDAFRRLQNDVEFLKFRSSNLFNMVMRLENIILTLAVHKTVDFWVGGNEKGGALNFTDPPETEPPIDYWKKKVNISCLSPGQISVGGKQ